VQGDFGVSLNGTNFSVHVDTMTLWGLDTINRMRALPPKTDRTLGMDHKGVCVCVCVCVCV
jgi:hypothetical protein